MTNLLNYLIHLLLMNRYFSFVFPLIYFSILNFDYNCVECLELHDPDLSQKTIISNMERMISDCEIKTTIHYKVILDQEMQFQQHKIQMAKTTADLDTMNKAFGGAVIIIFVLLLKIAFSK